MRSFKDLISPEAFGRGGSDGELDRNVRGGSREACSRGKGSPVRRWMVKVTMTMGCSGGWARLLQV